MCLVRLLKKDKKGESCFVFSNSQISTKNEKIEPIHYKKKIKLIQ